MATAVMGAYWCYSVLSFMLYLGSTGPGTNWPNVTLVILLVAIVSVAPLAIGVVLLRYLRRKSLLEAAGGNDR